MEAYITHIDARLNQGAKPQELIAEMMTEFEDFGSKLLAAISVSGDEGQAAAIVRAAAKRVARRRRAATN